MQKGINTFSQSSYELLFEQLLNHLSTSKSYTGHSANHHYIEDELKNMGKSIGGKMISIMILRRSPLPSRNPAEVAIFIRDKIWQTLFNSVARV